VPERISNNLGRWKAGIPAAVLVLLAASCSSHVGRTSSVVQGGVQPPASLQADLPATGDLPAGDPAAPEPSQEALPTGESSSPAPPKAAPSADPPKQYARPAIRPRPSTEESFLPSEGIGVVVMEEMEPSPELVSPDDDRLIEEIESSRETVADGDAPSLPEVKYDIPMEQHVRVLDYIELFQTSRRQSFTRGLSRSRKYEKIIMPILAEEGVPTDLYYLALIESAFNPRAYSRAQAMGIWQFIYTTGRAYGLKRSHWIDERRDPVKATRAAARHLKDLHDDLGSWPLALAGYNAGINRVKRDIKKAGTRDFWKLRLPAQTRNYVPAFYAALIIGRDPESYGFTIDYDPPVEYETVEVDGGTRLSLVATFCRTSLQEIRDINPEIRQGCAPPGSRYTLRVPPGKSGEVVAGLASTPRSKITGWGRYEIHSGDTLSTIARSFGTTVEAIQEVNNLPGHFIRAGNTLMIPGGGLAGGSIPNAPYLETAIPSSGTYRVRRGDSLWSISRRYGISLEHFITINGLRASDPLQIGQVLSLKKASGTGTVASAKNVSGSGTVSYRVRKGDNLWSIARRFGTDVPALLRANGLRSGQTIYPGEQLIIPGGSL
jgi:membrane-bound lytic murein transglycosylase D